MLHVTNGDSAAQRLRDAGLPGDVLPWRDALHEGPVPSGHGDDRLRAARARFVAARGWAGEADALAELEQRDERLARALATGEEIVLWFETDLYDVLQLVQVLDRVAPGGARLVLAGEQEFTGVAELAGGTPALPALGEAVQRHLQQFPWRGSGLNRTERALLDAVAGGARTRAEAFVAQQRQEERPFLGDAIAFGYLAALPLTSDFRLTDRGRAILAGERAWEERPERWLGGVRLPAGEAPWSYDAATARLAYDAS
jgi:hypothetical protein